MHPRALNRKAPSRDKRVQGASSHLKVSSVMRMKTLASHFLTCIVSLASLIGAQQAISRQADVSAKTAMVADQVANRAAKGDRLPAGRALPNAQNGSLVPKPRSDANCKQPIDVVGRCFADARLNQGIA